MRQWTIAAFCLLYGLSNGIMTIVRGTVPQTLFGREHYGAVAGTLAGPTLVCQAAGPFAFAALIQAMPSPYPLMGLLLLVSLFSLGCYLSAIRREVHGDKPLGQSGSQG